MGELDHVGSCWGERGDEVGVVELKDVAFSGTHTEVYSLWVKVEPIQFHIDVHFGKLGVVVGSSFLNHGKTTITMELFMFLAGTAERVNEVRVQVPLLTITKGQFTASTLLSVLSENAENTF